MSPPISLSAIKTMCRQKSQIVTLPKKFIANDEYPCRQTQKTKNEPDPLNTDRWASKFRMWDVLLGPQIMLTVSNSDNDFQNNAFGRVWSSQFPLPPIKWALALNCVRSFNMEKVLTEVVYSNKDAATKIKLVSRFLSTLPSLAQRPVFDRYFNLLTAWMIDPRHLVIKISNFES